MVLCLVASVGALVLVGPRLSELRGSVLGLGGDPYQTLWRFSAFAEAVSQRTLVIPGEPFRNFAPLPWLPLHVLFGEPLGYNLVWLLQFPLTALVTYGLARFLGIPRASAALVGLLVAFAPYRIGQSLGHFGAMQVFWIPLTMVALLWLLRRPSLPRTLLVAAAFIGASWTEHVLFLTTLVAAVLTITVFRHQAARILQTRRGVLLGVILFTLVGALGILPFRAELQDTARSDSSLNPGTAQRLRFAPTAGTLFAPPRFHRFVRSPNLYGTPRDAVADRVHALGLLAPVIAVAGLRKLWQDGQRQHFVLLGSLVAIGLFLALAPRTSLGAQVYDELPVVAAVRTVNRFLALPALAVPLLASIGLSRFPRKAWGVLAALLLIEILPASFPIQETVIPRAYASLAQGPAGPLLEIPAAADYLVASRAQYASVVHHRAILASNVFERVQPREQRQAALRIPVV
ncbi:MAG: hypothetical protein Q8R32_01095, partial [bacterium]|nr:hypothetical protein [bacterium]